MATINQSFTYKLPEELYVAGISTTKTGTYTYIGPDKFDVEVDGQGRIIKCDPTETPDGRKKPINANNASESAGQHSPIGAGTCLMQFFNHSGSGMP